jgi:hypothetical protein
MLVSGCPTKWGFCNGTLVSQKWKHELKVVHSGEFCAFLGGLQVLFSRFFSGVSKLKMIAGVGSEYMLQVDIDVASIEAHLLFSKISISPSSLRHALRPCTPSLISCIMLGE